MTKPRKAPETISKNKKAYTPTPKDKALVTRHIRRRRQARQAPKVSIDQNPAGELRVDGDHPDMAVWSTTLMEVFGTVEPDFANEQLIGLINALCVTPTGPVRPEAVNACLALINGIAPRDEIEAALATQMAATNHLALDLIRQTRQAGKVSIQQIHGNLAAKLLRAFTSQLEALQRYRGKGQQKIIVERVNVSDGGQAIVGHVEQGSVGSSKKTEEQSHAKQNGDASKPTLRRKDPSEDTVSGTCRKGQTTLPDARWNQRWRADGQ